MLVAISPLHLWRLRPPRREEGVPGGRDEEKTRGGAEVENVGLYATKEARPASPRAAIR
jgi:hypothetical protein